MSAILPRPRLGAAALLAAAVVATAGCGGKSKTSAIPAGGPDWLPS